MSGSFFQCACIKIKGKNRELAVYVIYRSPNSSRANDEALCSLMRQMRGNCLVLGDFNFPGIQWATGSSDAKGRDFLEVLEDGYMIQHVDEATHISGNILDLVITKDEGLIQSVKMEGRLGKSDHELMLIEARMEAGKRNDVVMVHNYAKADYDAMRAKT